MNSGQDRLLQFDRDLLSGKNICSSEGIFVNFPPSLKKPFRLLQNLKLAVFGNKQTFARFSEMLFLIKRKLEITLAANNQPQSFHLERFLQ